MWCHRAHSALHLWTEVWMAVDCVLSTGTPTKCCEVVAQFAQDQWEDSLCVHNIHAATRKTPGKSVTTTGSHTWLITCGDANGRCKWAVTHPCNGNVRCAWAVFLRTDTALPSLYTPKPIAARVLAGRLAGAHCTWWCTGRFRSPHETRCMVRRTLTRSQKCI